MQYCISTCNSSFHGPNVLHFHVSLVQLWDVRRKGCIFTYKGHSEVINSIQFSPDGKWVVSASSDSTTKVLVGLLVVSGPRGGGGILVTLLSLVCYKCLPSLPDSSQHSESISDILSTCDCHRQT